MAFLSDGPYNHNNCSVLLIVDRINSYGNALGDALRAWLILGYVSDEVVCGKPTQPVFERQVQTLWQFLVDNDNSIPGREARAHILEALRALRYHRRSWTVSTRDLGLTLSYDAAVAWADLEDPDAAYTDLRDAAYDQLGYPDYRSVEAAEALGDHEREDKHVWTRYHAYQGFVALDLRGFRRRFRAIPAPGENSLWHSISFHKAPRTPDGFFNMMRHYEVKACIWAYFTQVLEHPAHMRWRDYMWLNYKRENRPGDQIYGRQSILRHLHCNSRVHGHLDTLSGNPVGTPDPNILHVIADYYGVQIVVFQYDQSASGCIDPEKPNTDAVYTPTAFGFMGPHSAEGQLFLVTSDYCHFDPVVWVSDKSPENTSGVPWFQVPLAHRGCLPAPWWAAGTDENLCREIPIVPCEVPHFALPRDPNVQAEAGLWEPSRATKLTPEILDLFRYGRDIRGNELSYRPTERVMNRWDGPLEKYDYEIDRESEGQIRFGDLAAPLDISVLRIDPDTNQLDSRSVFRSVHKEFPGGGSRGGAIAEGTERGLDALTVHHDR